MRVNCPNCATVFDLPDSAAKQGAKLRCSVCRHVFALGGDAGTGGFERNMHEEAPPEPSFQPEPDIPAPAPPQADDDFGTIFQGLDHISDDVSLSDNAAPPPSEEEILGLEDGEDLSFNLDSKPKGKRGSRAKSGRKSSPVLLLVLFLVAAGAVGYLYWDDLKSMLPFLGEEEAPEEAAPVPEEPAPGTPFQFSFSQDLNHFFMDNTKIGRIFVIQGMVVNDYDTPKSLIKLEAQILDEQGNVIESKTQLIGNTVTYYQLETFSQEELENAINHDMGVSSHNINVPHGGEVPFVFVFYNPPEELVSEFMLRVVEAKNPTSLYQ